MIDMRRMAGRRAQTSFEFMLYLTVAVLSLAAVLPMAMRAYSPIRGSYDSMRYSALAGSINYNMQFAAAEFSAYVPAGMCTDGLSASPVDAIGGSPLNAPVAISASVCALPGGPENLSLSYAYNGMYALAAAPG